MPLAYFTLISYWYGLFRGEREILGEGGLPYGREHRVWHVDLAWMRRHRISQILDDDCLRGDGMALTCFKFFCCCVRQPASGGIFIRADSGTIIFREDSPRIISHFFLCIEKALLLCSCARCSFVLRGTSHCRGEGPVQADF